MKNCFLLKVGSVYHVKQVHLGGIHFSGDDRGCKGDAEVAETAAKRLLCC
jgi:hypothetical protein